MSASWQWAKANPDTAARLIRELQRENTELRNEIVRLNGQTNWVCKCGGTDCEGQKENAALREAKDAYFKHNNILVQLMTEDQKQKALEILMSRPKEAQP